MEPSGLDSGAVHSRERLPRTQETARGARTHQRALRRLCWYPPTCSRLRSSSRRRLRAAKAPSRDEQGEGPARPPASTELRVNPFLLPDAAAPSAQAPRARARIRSSIRSIGSRLTIAIGSGARSASTWFGVRAHRRRAPRRTSLRLWLAATSGATLVVIAAVVLQPASPLRSGPASGSRPAVTQSKPLLGAVADAQTVRRELYWTAARPASEAHKPRIGKEGRRSGGATHSASLEHFECRRRRGAIRPAGGGGSRGSPDNAESFSRDLARDKLSWLRVERRVSRELDEPACVRGQWNAWTRNQPRLMTIESEPR